MDVPASATYPSSPAPTARPAAATVCVTGITGYIGSWLVRSLLRRGYAVHATARDLGRASELLKSLGIGDDQQLKLFKADMNEEGSFDEAVQGCEGVFHVAASMQFSVPPGTTDLEDYVQSNIVEPAVRGTINLLRSCQRAGSVRRVVFTSSTSTITARDSSGNWNPAVDESSLIPVDVIWKTKPNGWVYALSKVLTEEAAFQFAKENDIDLVSIIPPTVAGPFFTPKVPASVQVLLSPITEDSELYPILVTVHTRLGSMPVVHIEDISDAHIFLMEHKAVEGRYLCSAATCVIPQLADLLSSEYPLFTSAGRFKDEFHDSPPSEISSTRLTDLGFEFKYGLKDIVKDSVDYCVQCGFLKDPKVNDEDINLDS